MKPIVALVGRPNVGKSTLFNRLTRSRDALVDDRPGVTRDRQYGEAVWDDHAFTVVDTGGFTDMVDDPFSPKIRNQVLAAISEADAVVLVLDGRSGLSPFDREMVDLLRRMEQPVFFTVNKIDDIHLEDGMSEFFALGIEPLFPISAEHRYGLGDFLDALIQGFPKAVPDPEDDRIRIAVVGRPNAGKSSLINRLTGSDRMVVSDVPGTTRDSVDTVVKFHGKSYVLVDTAGIRRKGKISEKIEKFSIIKALRSLDRCDVALIVLDASEGVTDQDITVAGYAHDRGCGVIFLLNKWDLLEKDTHTVREMTDRVHDAAKFLRFAPVVSISALTGQRLHRIYETIEAVYSEFSRRIGTGPLNRILTDAIQRREPPIHGGRRLKFYYATQVEARPPTFVVFVSHPKAVHFSYQRYLINQVRQGADLKITPIRLHLRERSGRMDFSDKPPRQRATKKGRRKNRRR